MCWDFQMYMSIKSVYLCMFTFVNMYKSHSTSLEVLKLWTRGECRFVIVQFSHHVCTFCKMSKESSCISNDHFKSLAVQDTFTQHSCAQRFYYYTRSQPSGAIWGSASCCLGMLTGGARDRTTVLLFSERPAVTPDPTIYQIQLILIVVFSWIGFNTSILKL